MRFARIAPCLLGLLVVLSILDRTGVPRFTINTQHTSLPRALFAALTFHVNWLEARTGYLPAAWDVLWSLSVEEVFYVFFPLLCTTVRKRLLLVMLLAAFVVVGPFARTVLTHNPLWADYGYLSCMDGIALGCLAAIVANQVRFGDKTQFAQWGLLSLGAFLCSFVVVFRGTVSHLGLYKFGLDVTVLEIGTALMVICMLQRFEGGATRSRWPTAPLRWFGRNSYEVYLTHMLVVWPMVWAFFHFFRTLKPAPLWFLLTAGLTGAVGYGVARFYSEPLNRKLRTTFLRRNRGSREI